jgi:hypothetical protein
MGSQINTDHPSSDQQVADPTWDQCPVRDAICASVFDKVTRVIDKTKATDLIVKLATGSTIFPGEFVKCVDGPTAALSSGWGWPGYITLFATPEILSKDGGNF